MGALDAHNKVIADSILDKELRAYNKELIDVIIKNSHIQFNKTGYTATHGFIHKRKLFSTLNRISPANRKTINAIATELNEEADALFDMRFEVEDRRMRLINSLGWITRGLNTIQDLKDILPNHVFSFHYAHNNFQRTRPVGFKYLDSPFGTKLFNKRIDYIEEIIADTLL